MTKISELPELTTLASADEFAVVDTSDTTTKRISAANAFPELTQLQVEDDTSTVYGQVSGERLGQAIQASRERGGVTVATTSGSAFDFTSIHAEVQKIEVLFDGVSLSGSDHLLVQIGTSGGVTTTGYAASSVANFGTGSGAGVTSTSGFIWRLANTVNNATGRVSLVRLAPSSNIWVSEHNGISATTIAVQGGGSIPLGAELTQVRITRTGTNTFDAGQLNVRWK